MENISQISGCVSCSACMQICPRHCITMKQDHKGFFQSVVDENACVGCGKCLRVCPTTVVMGNPGPSAVYAGRLNDREALQESTSGGIFAALSQWMLKQNGWVCGCVLDETLTAKHVCSREIDTVCRMKGAKYVQSDISEALSDVVHKLAKKEPVLFVGTPCQVAAIQALCKEKKLEAGYLFTVDIICHGVPSPMVFQRYVSEIEQKYGKIVHYEFRSKKIGWRGQNVRAVFADGSVMENTEEILSYSRLYFNSLITLDTCHQCRFANTQRVGDITIGDFWGINRAYPPMDDNQGVSEILVNTPTGAEMLQQISEELELHEVTLDDAMQANLKEPTQSGWLEKKFWRILEKKGYWEAYNRTKKLSPADRLWRKLFCASIFQNKS